MLSALRPCCKLDFLLSTEKVFFNVVPLHCSAISEALERESKGMASSGNTGVENWDAFFKQNKKRLVPQFTKKYKARTEVESKKEIKISPELNKKVALWKGDITKLPIDAIVNAANSSLLGGGGVDGAIHRTAGPKLKEECRNLNGCKVGEAKITGGYNLPSKYVIHTVGPQGEKPDLLKSCYSSSLDLMLKKHLRSVAFPCISTGVYGYPQESAARVALSTVRSFLDKHGESVDQVIFCLFLAEDVTIYENLMQVYFPIEE